MTDPKDISKSDYQDGANEIRAWITVDEYEALKDATNQLFEAKDKELAELRQQYESQDESFRVLLKMNDKEINSLKEQLKQRNEALKQVIDDVDSADHSYGISLATYDKITKLVE